MKILKKNLDEFREKFFEKNNIENCNKEELNLKEESDKIRIVFSLKKELKV